YAPRNYTVFPYSLLNHPAPSSLLFPFFSFSKPSETENPPSSNASIMKEEAISSGGTMDPTPATASSAGASSRAGPVSGGKKEKSGNAFDSKLASLTGMGSKLPGTSILGSARLACRPWERGDLLRRLATFNPSSWYGKPKATSSLACAQRGWMNVDVDKIVCESCGASLSFVLLPSWTKAEVKDAEETFAKQLDTGHGVNCPWRGHSCLESIVQFPPTPQSALIGGYKDRCDGLLQFQLLPIVAASAVELMRVSRGPLIDRFLSQSQNPTVGEGDQKLENIQEPGDGPLCLYYRAQRLISLCGWEPRWLANVQDCEEHSAQSARNAWSFGPALAQVHPSRGLSNKSSYSASARKDNGKSKMVAAESICDSRSPLLDCSLCGATVRILDFLTVSRPTRFIPNDLPDGSKKLTLTRGVSAASGISGWVAADDADKEQTEDRDEVATTNKGKLPQNADVDLNLTMAGGLSFIPLDKMMMADNNHDVDLGRDLMIGQPAGSEVGDRAASFESRGPSSRKRSLEIGGSSDNRPHLIHPADSVEGTVIDRDGDEVTDGRQFCAGPSKRARDTEFFDSHSSYPRYSSGAGPSHSVGIEINVDGNRVGSFRRNTDHVGGIPSTRDSTRASSVIAMDTVGNGGDDDSMESVENYPGDVDDVHLPSSSTYGNIDMNETSELNNSNQAQQSIGFRPVNEVAPGEMGVSSTNDGDEIFNAETVTAQARDGFSFGISGGSVGMCASHEAEIHGADFSVHRADSVVGDMEPRVEDVDNQGQTGESAPDPGLMDEVVPDDVNREDPQGDSQELLSRSVERADSGSKVDCSTKADSVGSGEKASRSCKILTGENAHPSLSCNAVIDSGCGTALNTGKKAGNSSSTNNGTYPPKGESNYEEPIEFDPIIHHNEFCPWVNGNVAAAGVSSSGSGGNIDTDALCGWQLTLDALDAIGSLANYAVQTGQSESAASLYKDDNQTPGQKLIRRHSMSRSHGQQ
ncbi:Zinc finger C3HC-type protein 1-like, partial [Linum perenne]